MQQQAPIEQVSFKSGEYLVHVLIEQTRALHTDNDQTVDPLIKVTCFGQTKFSSKKHGAGGTATTLWNEHFHFTHRFSDGRELQAQSIEFTVLDHNTFGRNGIIGSHELDFTTVYMMDNHVAQHKWLGITNPEKDFNLMTGFLKVSIDTVAEGDQQQMLTMESEYMKRTQKSRVSTANVLADGDLLLPPQIHIKGQQLKVTLIRAEKLMKMDTLFGTIDPYLVFEACGFTIKTEFIKKNQNPIWELQIYLPMMQPSSSEYITMTLFDCDEMKDDLVATTKFKTSDIIARGSSPFWVNMYGVHIDADQTSRNELCQLSELGTLWAGRILLGLEVTNEINPKKLIQPITDRGLLANAREENQLLWDLYCEVQYAINCPKGDGTYSVKVRWGDYETKTNTQKARNGLCEYFELLSLPKQKFPGTSHTEIPDIFIYLMDGDTPICFKRWNNKEVMLNNEFKDGYDLVVTLLPDKSLKNTPIDQAGILRIRILTQPTGAQFKQSNVKKPKEEVNGKLFINLFQAENLMACDFNGLADPFMEAYLYDQKAQSPILNNTLNPIWNKQLQLNTYCFELQYMPPLILRFFDEDNLSKDYMGRTMIDFQTGITKGYIKMNTNQIAEPAWLDIKICGQQVGRVLVSFNYNQQLIADIPHSISPKTTKYFIKIKMMGLRQLKAFGFLPVNKAFVKLNVQGIRQYGDQNELNTNDILTQPRDTGPNPNIQQILLFDIMLPENEAFIPRLQGSVHDYIFKGFIQPLIGQFQIDLSKQKAKTMQHLTKQLHLLKQLTHQEQNENVLLIKEDIRQDNCSDLLANLGILQGNSIDMNKIVGYVKYIKVPEEGIFVEEIQYPKEYIALGYDTKEQKSNQHLISGANSDVKENATVVNKIQQIQAVKAKNNRIAQVAQALLKKDQVEVESKQIIITEQPQSEKHSIKHYRLCIPCNLEDSIFMNEATFDEFRITKGSKDYKEVGSMSDLVFGIKDHSNHVGKLKGWVDVISEIDLKSIQKDPYSKLMYNELGFTGDRSTTSATDKEIVMKNQVTIRIYVVDCFNLPPKDLDSMSDPYVKIKLGNEEVGSSDDHVNDDCNPKFFKMYSINTELPGASELIIKVFDYDDFLPDDLIGQTTIDLEERYYQTRFRQLKYIPVETRQLYHPSSSIPQGQIRLFVEIIPSKQATLLRNPWFIDQRPKAKFYLKVVVWDVYDVPAKDVEDTSDIYVVGYVEENHKQVTDTHYRSRNGKGSFNWRMIFPLELPQPETILSFQIFDKDIFSPDDFISDCSYDITNLAQKAFENEINIKMYGMDGLRKSEKIEIVTQNVQRNDYKVKLPSGKIYVSVELVPEDMHLNHPVGIGRSSPNHSPYCPEPLDRIKFSLNPMFLLNQLLSVKARAMVYGFAALILMYILMKVF